MKYSLRFAAIFFVMIAPFSVFAQAWSQAGNGLDGTVSTVCVYQNTLYAGGEFTGGPDYLARLNGAEWENVGSALNGPVSCMAEYQGKLYVSGNFTKVNGADSKYIAAWDGSQWQALNWGLDYFIVDMEIYNGELFFVGNFHTAGGNNVTGIARFNGSSVNPAGIALFYGPIYALGVLDGKLWAGGNFPQVGSTTALNLAYWNGTSWEVAGGGAYGPVFSLDANEEDAKLYLGGAFNACYGISANNVAGINLQAEQWFALGNGVMGDPDPLYTYVRSVIHRNGKLYVGGRFETAGTGVSSGFGIYDEVSGWMDAGSTLDGHINDMVIFNNYLYAGGNFSSPAMNIARWSEPTGIGEQDGQSKLLIRPNPAREKAIVELAGFDNREKLQVTVAGSEGKIVAIYDDVTPGLLRIDVSRLSPGTYVVKVCDSSGAFVSSRLIVDR